VNDLDEFLAQGVPPPLLEPPSVELIAKWLREFVAPGQVTEARFLGVIDNPKYPAFTASGYFDHDHIDDMAEAVAKVSPMAEGSYFVFNLVEPELLSLASNRLRK
jgi:hypothetical protein